MKETANDNAVIVLDDPDVIGLDNPNVIQGIFEIACFTTVLVWV